MDMAISYNRWYAMGIVRSLFADLANNISVQSELAIRLSKKRLNIYNIFESENQLPPMIRNVYQSN